MGVFCDTEAERIGGAAALVRWGADLAPGAWSNVAAHDSTRLSGKLGEASAARKGGFIRWLRRVFGGRRDDEPAEDPAPNDTETTTGEPEDEYDPYMDPANFENLPPVLNLDTYCEDRYREALANATSWCCEGISGCRSRVWTDEDGCPTGWSCDCPDGETPNCA